MANNDQNNVNNSAQTITYTITVSNAGPGTATNTTVTDTIPANTTFVSATPSQGTCSGHPAVTCNLGTITAGANATITLVVTAPSTPQPIVNMATVASNETDGNPVNNTPRRRRSTPRRYRPTSRRSRHSRWRCWRSDSESRWC